MFSLLALALLGLGYKNWPDVEGAAVRPDGGGVVAEALPSKRKKLRADEASELKTIIHDDAEAALGAALRLASWKGIAVDEIPVRTGLPPRRAGRRG